MMENLEKEKAMVRSAPDGSDNNVFVKSSGNLMTRLGSTFLLHKNIASMNFNSHPANTCDVYWFDKIIEMYPSVQ